jgi:hypothetical protein
MKSIFEKIHNTDFKRNGALRSNIRFEACIEIARKTCKVIFDQIKGEPDELKTFWVLTDEFGASFSCSKKLGEAVRIGETYIVYGDISICRGCIYLNVKQIEFPDGTPLLMRTVNLDPEQQQTPL